MALYVNRPSARRLVEGPCPSAKSQVAIATAADYSEAEKAVRRAVDLLGGAGRFARAGDVVLIKPNMIAASHPEEAEVTHPAVIEAVIRLFKEVGATVKVGEQTGWQGDPETTFAVTGMVDAARRGGVDEIANWDQEEYVDVDVPNGRFFGVVKLPRSLVEADVIVNLPKLKTNIMHVTSLGIKNWMGALHNSQRTFFHKTTYDIMAMVDVLKALGDRVKLNVLDGISGMDGAGPHSGLVTHPGIVLASPDVVALDAVACAIMDIHPYDPPANQAAMKDGLGTADLREIDVLGPSIDEVKHPFRRPVVQVVNRYPNVMEFLGGVCNGACLNMINGLPPYVDAGKRYAIVVGARAMIGQDLAAFDEVWLGGMCACASSHQLPGFGEKVKRAKKVVRLNYCPAHSYHMHYWQNCAGDEGANGQGGETAAGDGHDGGAGVDLADGPPTHEPEVYSAPMLLLADLVTFAQVPDITDETKLEEAIARKEGRMSLGEAWQGYCEHIGEEAAAAARPRTWRPHPLSAYANVDREWPEPEQV